MPEAQYEVGDSFPVQFAWRLPNNDYLRAVFQADIVGLVPGADKYVVRLSELIAGRQETEAGEMRPKEEFSKEYWALVGRLIGHKVSLAYEADDGRALYMRLATLTGEHNFFTRFDTVEEKSRQQDDSLDFS
jgi:hypothetical protein